jgi:large subunit ribosomal protein L31e
MAEQEGEVKKEIKKEKLEKAGVEQVFTIPLSKAKSVPRWKRSNKAIKVIKAYLARHLKAEESKIHIDASINEKIWSRGSQKPPLRIRVRAMKFEDGVVEAELKD